MRCIRISLLTLLYVFLVSSVWSQEKGGVLSGKVVSFETGEPIAGCLIKLEGTVISARTGKDGIFVIPDLKPGKYTIVTIKSGHYSTISDPVEVFSGKKTFVELKMLKGDPEKYLYFSIGGITVTAERDLLPETHETVHKISSGEIEHMQATNLGDILDLIPGVDRKNRPGLQRPTQLGLRGVEETGADYPDLLGTRIEVDDIPISNNANLNTGTGVGYGSNVRTLAGQGVDLRIIPADNIQEVEVIAGVPSVEYGDVTSGIVKVKTRTGVEPFRLKLKNNPDTREFNFSGGFRLASHTTFNFNVNDAYSLRDLRVQGDEVNRLSLQGRFNHLLMNKKLNLTETVRFTRMFEDYSVKDDPKATTAYNHDYFWVLGQTAEYKFSHASSLYLRSYLNYTRRQSYVRKLEILDPTYVTDRMTTGTQPAFLIADRYTWAVTTTGKEYSAGVKLNYRHRLMLGNRTVHNFLLGGEFRTEGNKGEGKQFNPLYPPYGQTGKRPRSFDEIPGFNQLSIYFEDRITTKIQWPITLTLGLRGEMYNPTVLGGSSLIKSKNGTFWNPRMGLKIKFHPNFQLRASYGISSKAPALLSIYPYPVFLDVLEYGVSGNDTIPLMTTYRYDMYNEYLKGYTQRKYEIGLDFKYKDVGFSFTGYRQKTRNSPGTVNLPYHLKEYFYPSWPNTDDKIVVREENRLLAGYSRKEGLGWTEREGVEVRLQTHRIRSLNMMFRVNGAYMFSRYGRDPSLSVSSPRQFWEITATGDSIYHDLFPIYPPTSSWRKKIILNYNLSYINKKLGIWLTFTMYQKIWEKRLYNDTGLNALEATGYYENGHYYTLTPEKAREWGLVKSIDETSREVYTIPGTYYFNMTVSKDIYEGMEVSLFVNNIFNDRNFYYNKYGSYEPLNPEIFYGIEFSMMVEPFFNLVKRRFF